MTKEYQTSLKDKILEERYARVSQNVRFDHMRNITILCVGTGAIGAAIEGWVRLGINRLYLFDNKAVKLKNLVAQNFCHSDIGMPKTEALKKRLQQCQFEKGNSDIPSLQIFTYGDFLAFTDKEIEHIIEKEKAEGRIVIFVMASDYHPVQARGNRIAIKHGVTVFWVGIYRMGKAGEIIFYVPGNDLPCYRCITETRYQFFDKNRLADHLKGGVGGAGISSGLPMAATFIDAVLSHLIIGYIHHDIEKNQHGRLFRRLLSEKRNLIQCQLDPEYMLNDSENIFEQIQGPDQIAFNTISKAESRSHECIDCHEPPGGRMWQNTDYTKENYRNHLEAISEVEAAFMHGVYEYKHPLLETYAGLFPIWEDELRDRTLFDRSK